MRTIFKYDLPQLPGIHSMSLPPGRVISVGLAHHNRGYQMLPVMWAEVNPEAPARSIEIAIAWTGQPMPNMSSDFRFVGTVVYDEGAMVQHVYVREPG
jgi:hypothetical protein